jgi:uncharacterized membrane-anchored protein YhcB (DUF1043 family)
MLELIIGLVAGFVAGALTFRNNAKKGETLIGKVQDEASQLKDKVKTFRK